ncbi:MAG: cobyrinic acid a,c-diamide synthase [Desulfobacterales bacterium]|nr:MAG: cobyrinic acid a,c-diamide synthase [Desulfobacterales bacterium]
MSSDFPSFPRILIAGLRGGSGKTTISLGVIAAWKAAGIPVAPFKKGPDYIDAGWLAMAAGRPCFNLDTYLSPPSVVRHTFSSRTNPGDTAVIEGNRGLFDSIELNGDASSAELAKLLGVPVILCADCAKTTRTMAAMICGCQGFDPDLFIAGIILNRIAGGRHENILRRNIAYYCGIPVLGAVPKLTEFHFPERHMGLVPTPEHELFRQAIQAAQKVARDFLDLDEIHSIARAKGKMDAFPARSGSGIAGHSAEISTAPLPINPERKTAKFSSVIGVIQDSAFQFYYPENLDALTRAGARLLYFSAISERALPEIDALYIGGGFPETHAARLAENAFLREDIRRAAEKGLPIYAECGGLMYLGKGLDIDGVVHAMCGIFPVVFGMSEKPRGLGYVRAIIEGENPFFKKGMELRGHEFRYSLVLQWEEGDETLAYRMTRGKGFSHGWDGLCRYNVLAAYTHILASGTPEWAPALVRRAREYRNRKSAGK